MATTPQELRKLAFDASANRLRLATAFVALHAPLHLFKKTMKINGVHGITSWKETQRPSSMFTVSEWVCALPLLSCGTTKTG